MHRFFILTTIVLSVLLSLVADVPPSVHAWNISETPVSYGTFGSSVDNYGQIAVDSLGRVYITGGGNVGGDIEVLDSSGNHIRYYGPGSSTGVAIDSEGNSYVVDWDSQVGSAPGVYKYDSNGNQIDISATDLGGTAYFQFAYSAAIDGQGNIYVSDWQGNGDADPVYKFNADGDYLATITGNGGSFDQITSIAVDGSDNLYILDGNNNRLQKFNSSGTFVMQVTGNGGAWSFPEGFTVDDDGNIYVSDSGNERIQMFNSSGVFQQELDASDFGVGSFSYLSGLAITDAGKLFVADSSRILTALFDRTVPAVSVDTLPANSTADSTPSITGSATDALTAISLVEYSVDGGSYQACTANDGAFDETAEAFTCIVAALSEGSHTMNVRATDSKTNTNSGSTLGTYIFVYSTTVPSSPPSASSAPGASATPAPTPASYPIIYRADVTGTTATVFFNTWAGPVSHYILEYGEQKNTFTYAANPIGDSGSTQLTIGSLQPDTQYYFRLTPVNQNTAGTPSPVFGARTASAGTTEPVVIGMPSPSPKEPQSASPSASVTVTISISDPELHPVEGIEVVLTGEGNVYSGTTDGSGTIKLPGVKSGTYTVTMTGENGETVTQTLVVSPTLTGTIVNFTFNPPEVRTPIPIDLITTSAFSILQAVSTPLTEIAGVPVSGHEEFLMEKVGVPPGVTTGVKSVAVAGSATAVGYTAAAAAFGTLSTMFVILRTLAPVYSTAGRSMALFGFDFVSSMGEWMKNIPGTLFFLMTGAQVRRRKSDGVVFDADNERPLGGAFVILYSESGNLSTDFTDTAGRYSVKPKPDTYKMRAEREGFAFPAPISSSDKFGRLYRQDDTITVSEKGQAISTYSVAMTPLERTKKAIRTSSRRRIIRGSLVLIWFASSAYSFYAAPTLLNAASAGFVGLMYMTRLAGSAFSRSKA